MAYDDIYKEEMRRREVQKAILGQAMQPSQGQVVSGRVVPYSPMQGLSKIGQALIAKGGMERGESRLEAARKERETEQQKRTEEIIAAAMGQEAIPGQPAVTEPLMGPEEFPAGTQEITPAVPGTPATPPDPQRAALMAASRPETAPMAKVASAMMGGRGSAAKPTATSEGFLVPDPSSPSGYRIIKDPTGKPYLPPYVDPDVARQVSRGKAGGKVYGAERATAQVDLPAVESNAGYLKGLVREATEHPGFETVVGAPSPGKATQFVPGTEAAGFKALQDQITGKQFMQAYETLKGGGQITELEGQKATDALSRMKTSQSEEEYKKAADEFIEEIDRLTSLAKQRATGQSVTPTQETQGGSVYVETRTLKDGRVLGKKADGTIEEIK